MQSSPSSTWIFLALSDAFRKLPLSPLCIMHSFAICIFNRILMHLSRPLCNCSFASLQYQLVQNIDSALQASRFKAVQGSRVESNCRNLVTLGKPSANPVQRWAASRRHPAAAFVFLPLQQSLIIQHCLQQCNTLVTISTMNWDCLFHTCVVKQFIAVKE